MYRKFRGFCITNNIQLPQARASEIQFVASPHIPNIVWDPMEVYWLFPWADPMAVFTGGAERLSLYSWLYPMIITTSKFLVPSCQIICQSLLATGTRCNRCIDTPILDVDTLRHSRASPSSPSDVRTRVLPIAQYLPMLLNASFPFSSCYIDQSITIGYPSTPLVTQVWTIGSPTSVPEWLSNDIGVQFVSNNHFRLTSRCWEKKVVALPFMCSGFHSNVKRRKCRNYCGSWTFERWKVVMYFSVNMLDSMIGVPGTSLVM